MPEPDLGHIFYRFWQAKSGWRAGAGLDLAIAKGIVEAHGAGFGSPVYDQELGHRSSVVRVSRRVSAGFATPGFRIP
ncbi:MAG: HAMP domain-containing histidine kinase [Gemmatimonadetes bacterium]|nr:HAMP domain-containing histidine kinase [Gemmatimonadota bacterium]